MERYKTYNEGSFIIDDFNGRKVLRACLECDRDVVIPDDIKAIKSEAFKDHTEIRSIKIPEGVFHIGEGAFAGCKHLKSVKIPASAESIIGNINGANGNLFRGCPELSEVTVSAGNKYFYSENNCIINKETKTLISGCDNSCIIPDGVLKIDDYSFSYHKNLTNVVIPDSVTVIGKEAFRFCKELKSVIIPDSVTFIGDKAFYGCKELIIKASVGSYAHKYASENGIAFEEI